MLLVTKLLGRGEYFVVSEGEISIEALVVILFLFWNIYVVLSDLQRLKAMGTELHDSYLVIRKKYRDIKELQRKLVTLR